MARAVLIVDDDPEVIATLREALADQDVIIEGAADAATANALLSERRFCGMVLDLVLADGTGFDVLRHVDNEKLAIPVVVVTGKLPNYVREILSADLVKLVFAKPIEPRMLAAVVLGLCGIGT
jgi:DNA-binding NtrC family response regulator